MTDILDKLRDEARPPKQKGECWVNIYPHSRPEAYSTEGSANSNAGYHRIACVRVEWTEGQGLEETNEQT